MRLFPKVDGTIDRFDRAGLLTAPFDLDLSPSVTNGETDETPTPRGSRWYPVTTLRRNYRRGIVAKIGGAAHGSSTARGSVRRLVVCGISGATHGRSVARGYANGLIVRSVRGAARGHSVAKGIAHRGAHKIGGAAHGRSLAKGRVRGLILRSVGGTASGRSRTRGHVHRALSLCRVRGTARSRSTARGAAFDRHLLNLKAIDEAFLIGTDLAAAERSIYPETIHA